MQKSLFRLLYFGLAASPTLASFQAVLQSTSTHSYSINIKPTAMDQATLQTSLARVMNTGQVQDAVAPVHGSAKKPSYRLLYSDSGQVTGEDSKYGTNAFRAVIVDYANRKTVYATGDDVYDPASAVSVFDSNVQPYPSPEELADAAEIAGLGGDAEVKLTMPPLIEEYGPDGSSERIIHILGRPKGSTAAPERFHVNMYDRIATQIQSGSAEPPTCSSPVTQNLTLKGGTIGNPGTAEVTIYRDGKEVWRMEVTRPSGSTSESNKLTSKRGDRAGGSGIELRKVRYMGISVLRRANLPILNVEYPNPGTSGCGPHYRDWQNEEYPFECKTTQSHDPADGFRICDVSIPRTILDKFEGPGFRGVGFYIDGDDIVMLSELEASWYRYVSEWRFSSNGVIKPRWGFGGVLDGNMNCVCVAHHHHAYWRLDFDIKTSKGHTVRECNSGSSGPPTCQAMVNEFKSPRNAATHRHWQVVNKDAKIGYNVVPGADDGSLSDYGIGDFWALAYDEEQFSDEVSRATDTKAGLDSFDKGRPIGGGDVVVWYAAHFYHDESDPHGHDKKHIIGPDLRPFAVHDSSESHEEL